MSAPLPFDVGWPTVVVDLGCPLQESGQVFDLSIAQIEVRHLAPARNIRGHGVHPGFHVCLEDLGITAATAVKHVGQFGSEVSTFAHDGMTTDTVVLFPQMFAAHHLFSELVAVIPLGHSTQLSVKSQGQEQQDEEGTSPQIYVPGHAFGKALGHWSLSLIVTNT